MNNITLKKTLGHLNTIITHKHWVFYYSCKLGIPWRGLVHDLSKFSPVEFWESVRYWDGKSSPIPKCKADKGYSLAWQHHKGHNTHHYEYWVDKLDDDGVALKMPWKDVLELIADYLGAGRAYQGKTFDPGTEYDWFINKIMNDHPKMHMDTMKIVGDILFLIKLEPVMMLSRYSKKIFKKLKKRYEEES